MVPGGFIMVPGGYIMVPGGYIMVSGGYLNKGVPMSCSGQLKRMKDKKEKKHSKFTLSVLFFLSCFVLDENLAAWRQGTRNFGRKLTRIKCKFSEHQINFVICTQAQTVLQQQFLYRQQILQLPPGAERKKKLLHLHTAITGSQLFASAHFVCLCVCVLCLGSLSLRFVTSAKSRQSHVTKQLIERPCPFAFL